jgi:hypothetical protein
MSRISRPLGTIALGLLSLTISSSARASYQTLTTQVAIPQTKTDFSNLPVNVPTFNSSLGTLASVVVSYTDSSTMQGFVKNTSPATQSFTVSENSAVSLSYGTSTLLTNNLIAQQSYTHLGPSQSAQFGIFTPTGAAGPTKISSGPLFEAFLQPSPSVMLTFHTLTTTTVVGGGGNISTGIQTTAGGMVTVEFFYTPFTSAVPEPSSLVMTAIGAVAFFGSSYRFRRNRRQSGEIN